jgi:hypothetical protein
VERGNQHKQTVPKTAVLNRDDQSYEPLSRIPASNRLTYALHQPAEVTATNIVYGPAETRFTLQLPKRAAKSKIQNPKSKIPSHRVVFISRRV